MTSRRRSGFRSKLLPGAATALLLAGLGSVGVALAGQASPAALPGTASTGPFRGAQQQPDSGGADRVDPAGEVAHERALRRATARQAAAEADRAAARDAAQEAARAAQDVAPPVRVVVPSLDIQSRLVPLGLLDSGEIEAPRRYDQAGWFTKGVRPGQAGAAVIAGHVDSTDGPGIFYDLAAAEPGAEILVEREDGSTATFRVDRLASYPKDEFPTVEVYATNGRELRLITCGGDFDDGHYHNNIVVFATLVAEG
jgi:sortase (surface protein transpeptidase)